MLLVEPYPLYLLLEEAEVATRTATAISALLAIYLERNLLVIGRYTHATLPKQTEDVVLNQYVCIVKQWEVIKFTHWIVCCFQELEHGVIE